MEIEEKVSEDGTPYQITRSSGNLWKDLGRADAEEHFAKVKLVAEMSVIAKERELSVRKLAALLETDHGRLSELLRGRVKGYTLDRLIGYLNKLGKDVEIRVSDNPESAVREAELSVTAK
jgi:predicted XRE-type DNA-binding protein